MLAHQTKHLDNAEILMHATKWYKHKFISEEKYESIKTKYAHPLYSPNVFIRIGLFVFTVISAIAANSLLMAITGAFSNNSETEFSIRIFIHGCIMLGILEVLIKEKKIYKSGIDDALLYMALGCFFTSICLLPFHFEDYMINPPLVICSLALPIFVVSAIRYNDMLVAATAFLGFILILFLLIMKTGEVSKLILPFFTMIVSVISFLITLKLRKKEELRFWDNSLAVVEIISLVLFYLAGNYFVVRTLSEELFNLHLSEGQDIPLAFIFYAFTALVPLIYVCFGLKEKDRTLLISGLILIAASVLTFKYYYSLGHHEITMTIGGIIMIVFAWLSINYLKTSKYGITYLEDKLENNFGDTNAEALIITQTFSTPVNNDQGTQLGGGKFGGGGADAGY